MLIHFYHLFIPLIITNILHMFVVKYNLAKGLAIPVNRELFGANKTYRGILFVTIVNAIIFGLLYQRENLNAPYSSLSMGALIGLAYVLMELPNSFIKRKAGIAPGAQSDKNKILFTLMDKTDSALGTTAMYCFLMQLSFSMMLFMFFTGFFLHISLSYALVLANVKESL